jgi:DNA-binding transcriptional LysR family regulator
MDLDALTDFCLVAAHGGLGKASRASGRSKATLSRRITELEARLGVRLVERGARGLSLTEAGEQLALRTEGPLHEVAEAMTAAGEGLSRPRGRLRIAAPALFSQLAMGGIAADFCAAHPEVTLEVVAEDRLVDLVEERFDACIRINPAEDSRLVGRLFARDRLVVVAAPSVRKPRRGSVRPVPAIVFGSEQAATPWTLDGGRLVIQPEPRLALSSFLMIRDAAVAGAGAALIPRSIAGPSLARGELVEWGVVTGQDVDLWVLHTSRRLPAPKVRAFVDFICARYPRESLVLAPGSVSVGPVAPGPRPGRSRPASGPPKPARAPR